MNREPTFGWLILVLSLGLIVPSASWAENPDEGFLVINSMTEGVKVYVDGELVGKTPFENPIPLQPGKHKLKATKPGYSTMKISFTIRARQQTGLLVDLLPFAGLVKFSSNISGAEVYVDNNLVGLTPVIQELVAGDHKIHITKEGYNDFITDINVKAGEKHFVDAALSPFQDFSPEVLAMAAGREKEPEKEPPSLALDKFTPTEPPEPAPAWYADLYKKWWVWAIAGAAVVAAITIPLAASGGEQPGLHEHDGSPHLVIDIRK